MTKSLLHQLLRETTRKPSNNPPKPGRNKPFRAKLKKRRFLHTPRLPETPARRYALRHTQGGLIPAYFCALFLPSLNTPAKTCAMLSRTV
jgi:hypothetical protein